MNKFKKIVLSLHGENKEKLGRIYQDKQVYISSVSSSEQPIEEERVFTWQRLSFWLEGTGLRNKERMILSVSIPADMVLQETPGSGSWREYLPYEDFLLRTLSVPVARFSSGMENNRKDTREKARFCAQQANECILRRSGLVYDGRRESFVYRVLFFMPLINGSGINAKSGFRAVRQLLDIVWNEVSGLDREALEHHVAVYRRQSEIVDWLEAHGRIAFVANGSILPRKHEVTSHWRDSWQGDRSLRLTEAVPFQSPESLLQTISFSDGGQITGMAVPAGITVITGGGYSGKSTLLDALEAGIYRHVPGDGREFVLTLPDGIKIYAEDGRPVQEMDLSLFFHDLPAGISAHHFRTGHASGSISQAANIMEAAYAGSRLFLIDEDMSATNFMIRDSLMRNLIKKEPIIPFTDRVRDLYEKGGISTILVIGGSGEYIRHADRILLMEEYRLSDVTERSKKLSADMRDGDGPARQEEEPDGNSVSSGDGLVSMKPRFLKPPAHSMPFYISQYIRADSTRLIRIDDFTSDVTRLTALRSESQLQTLAYFLERMIGSRECGLTECRECAREMLDRFYGQEIFDGMQGGFFGEEIRILELLGALFRMRGIELS